MSEVVTSDTVVRGELVEFTHTRRTSVIVKKDDRINHPFRPTVVAFVVAIYPLMNNDITCYSMTRYRVTEILYVKEMPMDKGPNSTSVNVHRVEFKWLLTGAQNRWNASRVCCATITPSGKCKRDVYQNA